MNIKHHLNEATLISYAAGSSSQAAAMVVASHLSVCPSCRARAQSAEGIGGALLDSLDPIALHDDALSIALENLTLENLDKAPATAEADTVEEKVTGPKEVPYPLSDYIGDSLDNLDWKRTVPGVYFYDLPFQSEGGGVSRLLRIAPGKAMLPHTHKGNELTMVLRGSFTDEMGRFTPGDIADLDSEIEHQPLVDSSEDCICLVATDAPLKFTTLLGKIVQPITGF